MKGVKYIGPYNDHSGYGQASRSYILALHRRGVPLVIEPFCFERNPPEVLSHEERLIFNNLEKSVAEFDKVIIHLTPDLLPRITPRYPGKHIISYTVWETDRLFPLWVDCLNQVDEVWVPSTWNKTSFEDSGVTVPVHVVPHGINEDMFEGVSASDSVVGNINSSTYVFYSILQWNARKNPDALIRAYYNSFTPADDVRLVLKAYIGRGMTPTQDAEAIKDIVMRIRADMRLPEYPKLNLITDSLSDEQLKALHMRGDCYISLPHGEGWGLTMFEAGLAGKPVIATGAGGNMEFMTDENSYPVTARPSFVYGMSNFNPWYTGNQKWFDPDEVEASELMRHVFSNQEEAKAKGALLQQDIKTKFSWDRVADVMVNRLED